MDWKAILALAFLAMPLAYCEIKSAETRVLEKVTCIEQKGNWEWNTCNFEK